MIIYEPVLFAKMADGHVFIEVDRDIYDEGTNGMDEVKHISDSMALSDLIDWHSAEEVVKRHDGLAHDVTAKK